MKSAFQLFFTITHLLFYFNLSGQGNDETLTYTVTNTWLEGNTDSQSMTILQSGEKAVAMIDGRKPKQVSDPALGIKSARPDRNMPLLIDLIGDPAPIRAGDRFSYVAESDAVITSLTYSLEKGKDKQTIEGHKTDHYILNVAVEWTYTSNGQESIGVSNGKADLWIAKKLPFSWLTYTVTDGFYQMAAVPLSYLHPDISQFLLMHFKEDLKKYGLLLKAHVESEQSVKSEGFSMNNRFVRELTVSELETESGPMPKIPDLPLVSEDQYKDLLGWLFTAGDMCEEEQGQLESFSVTPADQNPTWLLHCR